MMRIVVRVLSVICLLLLMAVPALADWSFTGDYVTGEMETQFLKCDLTEKKEQSDLTGGILGIGFTNEHFLFNYDFIYKNLDTAIAGDDVNRLHDLRLGYRFYDTPIFKAALLLSHIYGECGNFDADGSTLGLGMEWVISGKWALEGRMGYCSEGVTVENHPYLEYEDPELLTLAASLNYQLNDCWSVHSSYRYYKFAADNHGVDLKSTVRLASVGVTYKIPYVIKAMPASNKEGEVISESGEEAEEGEVISEPGEEAEEGEVISEPGEEAEEGEVISEPGEEAEEGEVILEPGEEAEEGEVILEPGEEAEEGEVISEPGEEAVNRFLQPIFFDFNQADIRADQVRVLKKNLEILKENVDWWILVGGHADQTGNAAYNERLSLRRAQKVKAWLLDNGISAKRVTVAAFGEENTYFHIAKEPNWESDRFVDIIMTDEVPCEALGIRK
jgi:outer membrane protein OmpA-like peptidoglycan-associated protein